MWTETAPEGRKAIEPAETLAQSLEAMHRASHLHMTRAGDAEPIRSVLATETRLADLLLAAGLLRLADEQWRYWQGEAAAMAEQIAQLKAEVSK